MTCMMRRMVRPTAVLLVILAATASAGLTNLPASSYYAGGTSNIFKSLGNGQLLAGRLEYTVYDTQAYPAEFTAPVPGSGRYVYAYQLFINSTNTLGLQNVGTDYFAVAGISQAALDAAWVGSTADGAGALSVTPSDSGKTTSSAYWEFLSPSVDPGNQSIFMLISSDGTPIQTTFDVIREDTDDIPGPGVPEPASMLLLSLGAVMTWGFRKRS